MHIKGADMLCLQIIVISVHCNVTPYYQLSFSSHFHACHEILSAIAVLIVFFGKQKFPLANC